MGAGVMAGVGIAAPITLCAPNPTTNHRNDTNRPSEYMMKRLCDFRLENDRNVSQSLGFRYRYEDMLSRLQLDSKPPSHGSRPSYQGIIIHVPCCIYTLSRGEKPMDRCPQPGGVVTSNCNPSWRSRVQPQLSLQETWTAPH